MPTSTERTDMELAADRSPPAAEAAPSPPAVALDYASGDRRRDEGGSLKNQVIRGGTVSFGAQIIRVALQFVSGAVLARLLTPADYGLVGMVTSIIALLYVLNDLGLSLATIQRAQISAAQINAMFWINVLASLGLALLTAAVSPAIAWFYGEPRLVGITVALGACFLLSGLMAQPLALFRRNMRLGAVAAADLAGLAAGFGAAVVLARRGAGPWALVGFTMVSLLVQATVAWALCGWWPGRPAIRGNVRELLHFGASVTGFNVVNYFSRNLDNVLIGRVWGGVALGFYSRAYNLMLLPLAQINDPISAVALPSLSRLQGEPERYKAAYLKFLVVIVTLSLPVVVFMIVMAKEVVRVMLGPQWGEAAVLFQILGVAALVQPILRTTGLVFVTLNRTDKMLRCGVLVAVCTVVSFIVGLPWGARGVASSYAAFNWIMLIPALVYTYGGTTITLRDVAGRLWKPGLASMFMAAGMLGMGALTRDVRPLARVAIAAPTAGAVWLAATLLVSRQWNPVRWARALL